MDLTSPKTIKELLSKYSTRPSKTMGQNFLIHPLILKKIIEAAALNSNDTVLEIGPGIGTLTQELAKNAKRIIAIEKDKAMVEILKETLQDYKNIEVLQGDALQITQSLPTNYKLVANLPYYITSPVIRKFLEAPASAKGSGEAKQNQPECMVLMVQKEVAQRICAIPPNRSILAVSVQYYATAKIISYVTKEKFWPSPKVDSAIIKIIPQINTDKKQIDTDLFFRVVKAGFSHPRKQLANNFLSAPILNLPNGFKKDREKIHEWLLKNNIQPNQRAETLSIQDWINLVKSY